MAVGWLDQQRKRGEVRSEVDFEFEGGADLP